MRMPACGPRVCTSAALLALGVSVAGRAGSEPRASHPAAAATRAGTPSSRSVLPEVFLEFAPSQRLPATESAYLAVLARQQSIDIRIGLVRPQVLNLASLRLDLGDGDPLVLHRTRSEFKTADIFTWRGETADRRGSALFAVRGQWLHGVVYSRGKTVRIAPLGGSTHAMWQVPDTGTDMGECLVDPGSPRFQELLQSSARVRTTPVRTPQSARGARFGDAHADVEGTVDIRLLAVYSDSAESLTPDIVGHIEFLVAWANLSYVNSQIEAASGGLAPHLTLAAAVRAEFSEYVRDNGYFLWRFTNPNDTQLGFVHDVRDSLAADVCVLLVGSDNPDSDGLAMGGPPDPATAFCLVETPFSLARPYILAHEVGHLQNAHHSDFAPIWAPPYARGYCHNPIGQPENRFWTIMCVVGGNKIPYWSNPNVTYEPTPGNRFPVGDEEHNNARVLGETAVVVASHRGGPTPVEVTDLEAVPCRDRIQLRWRLAAEALRDLLGVEVRRTEAIVGPYSNRTPVPLVPESRMTFEDTEVRPGQTYWYSLGLLRGDVAPVFIAPIAATVLPWKTVLVSCSERQNGMVRVEYDVGPETADVRLHIYDVRGRLVRVLDHGSRPGGRYTEVWDRRDHDGERVARGIYMLRLNAGNSSSVRRVVLVRE